MKKKSLKDIKIEDIDISESDENLEEEKIEIIEEEKIPNFKLKFKDEETELEQIIESPRTNRTRFIEPDTNQQPIENLEQGLRNSLNDTNKEEVNKAIDYSSSIDYNSQYDQATHRNVDREMDVTGGSLMRNNESIQSNQRQNFNLNAWQDRNVDHANFNRDSDSFVMQAQNREEDRNLPFKRKQQDNYTPR
jgi:hypothetical protein